MAKENSVTGFRQVDQSSHPDVFVRYLDTVSALDVVQQWKARTFALLDAREGQHLLDVGCGLGDDVRALAQQVGHAGRVVGVDTSTTMIEEARKRATGQPLPVEYYVSDAHSLDFPDETFDGCRAERVFVHLANPQAALTELMRVTRSGGRIVVGEPDFDSFLVAGGDRELARKLMHYATDSMARNGWMGRQLWALFQEAGLMDVTVVAVPGVVTQYETATHLMRLRETAEQAQAAGVVSTDEATQWLEALQAADRAGRFFAAYTLFCVGGRKP